jgi:hypothetical protein
MELPEWPLPTDAEHWQAEGRDAVRSTLLDLLGELPPRPDPAAVEVVSREQHDGYTLERFQFHNGVDMMVPGILLIPDNLKAPAPVIVGLHGH